MSCTRVYQTGTVTTIDARRARIAFAPFTGCSACQGRCGFAQVATLLGQGRPPELLLPADVTRGFAVGDRVSVGIRAGRLLGLVALTYTLPLVGLLVGALLVSSLMSGGDGLAAAGGGAGGALAAWPALRLRRHTRSTAWLEPEVRAAE